MHIAIDLIIVVIMAATIFKAAKRGFVVSLFSLLKVVLSLAVALMFYKELGSFISQTFVYSHVEAYVSDFVAGISLESGGSISADVILAKLPEEARKIVDTLGIDIAELLSEFSGIPEEFAEKLSFELSTLLSNALAFVTLFFVSLIALSVVCFVLDIFSKLPVLNGINKIFGFALGVLEAFVLGIIIAKFAVTFCGIYGAIEGDTVFIDVIDKTLIARLLIAICPW